MCIYSTGFCTGFFYTWNFQAFHSLLDTTTGNSNYVINYIRSNCEFGQMFQVSIIRKPSQTCNGANVSQSPTRHVFLPHPVFSVESPGLPAPARQPPCPVSLCQLPLLSLNEPLSILPQPAPPGLQPVQLQVRRGREYF